VQKVEYIPNQLFLQAASPLGFCFQFSLEAASAAAASATAAAAAAAATTAAAAAASPGGQKRLGQPVIAFCLFLLPCFTTATYTTTVPPSVVVCFFTPSRLPLLGFFFFLLSFFSFQVSFLCMYLGLGFMTDF
jgi:hypothetical protein